jgi:hypothetical protein
MFYQLLHTHVVSFHEAFLGITDLLHCSWLGVVVGGAGNARKLACFLLRRSLSQVIACCLGSLPEATQDLC